MLSPVYPDVGRTQRPLVLLDRAPEPPRDVHQVLLRAGLQGHLR